MFSFWTIFDVMTLMLSNFFWTKRLINLCFIGFTANNWLDLREAAIVRDSNMLMSDKATLIGKAHLPANTGIERLPVITPAAINTLSTAFERAANVSSFQLIFLF